MKFVLRFLSVTLVAASLPGLASAAVIEDDLNADTSADYSQVNLGAASNLEVLFGFDYSGIVGPAPSQGDASTTGVKITANRFDGVASAATLFHNTPVPANSIVTVDLYMGFTGTGGTTEFGSVGTGSTGTTPFTIFSPIDGDGTFFTHTGDGGSSSDWRWSRPGGSNPSASVPVNNSSNSYILGSTNAPEYNNVTGLVDDPLHAPDPGETNAGNGGNQWITLSIRNDNGNTSISINGEVVVSGASVGDADDSNRGGNAPGGFASFSYADVFGSVASPGDSQFGIFDNFRVEAIPEPTSIMLMGMGVVGLLARRRR